MENASKALLMAGGILLVMLIIALVIFARSSISDYYASQDEIANIQDVAKFNNQFTGYERDNVSGYELVSLANQVADYNYRNSNAQDAQNDKGYTPIEIEISFVNNTERQKLAYKDDNVLFLNNTIKTNSSTGSYNMSRNTIGYVLRTASQIEGLYNNSSDVAGRIAKSISSIVREEVAQSYYNKEWKNLNNQEQEIVKQGCVNNFNKISGLNIANYTQLENYIGTNGTKIYQYYEYYQFKKAIFKCTSVKYDGDDSTDIGKTGRVKNLKFEFTGNIE